MTRSVNASAGVDWLKKAINLGRDNPRAVFGGAFLSLVAVMAVAFVGGLVQGLLGGALGTEGSMMAAIVVMLVMMVVLIAMASMVVVGFLRLIDDVESGRPTRATAVFAGFSDIATSLRVIGFALLMTILQNLLLALVLGVFASGVISWYLQVVTMSPGAMDPSAMVLPDGLGIATVAWIAITLVFYGAQAIGVGQIALRQRGVFAAIGDGFAGTFRNLPALLVLTLVGIVALVVAGILGFIVAMVVGVLAGAAGVWLGVVLGIPLYLAFLLAFWVVSFGVVYHIWRDVCGGSGDAQMPAEPVAVGA